MALILFGVFIALLLLGVPVAFAICSAAATTMFAGFGTAKMMIVVQRMFASCDSFSLIAVPFFIFAGDLLAGGKISKVLVEFCESLLGMIKGRACPWSPCWRACSSPRSPVRARPPLPPSARRSCLN